MAWANVSSGVMVYSVVPLTRKISLTIIWFSSWLSKPY
jgi:hypothetical protein